ncbi:MAG TPA: glycosyltransferase family 1 protein [Acidimicrobiales bacterium]
MSEGDPMVPVRVGVNLLWLVPGEVGGSEEYTVRLLGALAELAPDDLEVTLYVTARVVEAHGPLTERFRTVVAPVRGASRPLRVAAESTWLAARARRDRVAVVHHAGGTMPPLRTVPGIVTLHDLQPLSNPERFGMVKRSYIRALAPRSLRAARAVICLTEFTAADAEERAGVPAERIRLVPSGVDDPGPGPDLLVQEAVLERYGLTGSPYVLYPAITYAHKNHETLVAAFARVARERPDLRLVLTGARGPYEAVVRSAVSAYGLDDAVVRPGRIPEADLDVLYRQAAMVAFPSRYEGFGLPVLEAMARGCPVVASRVAALPGVLGGAAVLVDPLDVGAWSRALADLLDDAGRRTVLARRGVERAHHFRWPDAAVALAAVYRDVARPSPHRLSEENG